MTTELEFTKLEDPFHKSSLFSLLPKTLSNRSGSGRLDTAEHLFESLVARGSPKVMQQAQIISNSVSAIDSLYKEGETIDASCKPHGQERRPALGRRRARFSIKPDGPSYSVPDRNINSNIDDIDDPDEYFKAFEEMEEAEKELQKLRGGVLIDAAQQDQVTKTRKRRPGLLGKRASYKHHISKDDAMAETLAKIEDKHHEVSNHSSSLINNELVDGTMSDTDNTHSNPQEPQLEDSFAEKENNELDHLMSSYKDLDEGEDEDYMRDIFNVKPIDVGKINLPTLPKCTLSTMSELPDKPPQTIRSPLVSISTFLKKQLSITNLQKDKLSFLEEDAADSPDSSASKSAERSPAVEPDSVIDPSRNSHPLLDKNCSPKSTGARNKKHSMLDHGDLQGVNIQHGTLVTEMSDLGLRPHDSQPKTHEVLEDSSHLLGETTKDDSSANIKDSNVPHANGCLYADVDANIQMPDARISEGELCPADTNQHCENQHGLSNNSTKELSLVPPSKEARRQKAPKRAVNKRRYSRRLNAAGNSHSPEAMDGKNQLSENRLVLPDTNYEHQVASPTLSNESGMQVASNRAVNKRKNGRKQNVAGNSHPPEAMDGSDQPSENHHVSLGTNSEHQVAFQRVSNESGTQKAPPHPRKRKINNKRHSLAGAGTLWKDGTRRSARHKFRPLEYWRGERLLFGRIHDSLATVIGVKYASPGKENLKVESYVSDEFADLLSLAAKG